MAKIVSYIKKTPISAEDKVIGSDLDNNGQTKNFKMSEIAEFVKSLLGSNDIVIANKRFILQKHPNNTVNLTTLEVNDVILGFEPSGSYIMAQFLGGNSELFFNTNVYNIFNGI